LDILYIDIVLGLRFWVLQEGVFGFKKIIILGKGVRVVVCFFRIFYFIGWGKKGFWTWCGEKEVVAVGNLLGFFCSIC
jgi:hypothetical protein